MDTTTDIYAVLKNHFQRLLQEHHLHSEDISITTKALTPEESIGQPKRRDFPLLTGKEVMMEANFRGSLGQAFTLSRAIFNGTLQEVSELDLTDNYNKAIFISSLNALMKYLGLIDRTVHCRNEEPEECACLLAQELESIAPNKKIVMIGYQPAIFEALTKKHMSLRLLELNPDLIGQTKHGVTIESGLADFADCVRWGDLFLVTGSTLANGSIVNFLNLQQPVYFYGNTIAGTAKLLDLKRFCYMAR